MKMPLLCLLLSLPVFARELDMPPPEAKAIQTGLRELESVQRGPVAPFCESCERSRDDSAGNASSGDYTLAQAIADIKSDRLQFTGRDYPTGSGGVGGNLSCFYRNSKVYIEMEGCRPTTTGRLSAFRVKIYSLDGKFLDVYVDNEGVDPLPIDNPLSARAFQMTYRSGVPRLRAGMSYRETSDSIQALASNFNYPLCQFSPRRENCLKGGSNPALKAETAQPGRMVRELHDLIQAVRR